MTAYESVLERLRAWDPDETFFRGYWFAERSNILPEFLDKNPPAETEWLMFCKDPSSIDPNKTEEMFFSSGRNVTVVKHPRYLPVFEHQHNFFEILYVAEGRCKQLVSRRSVELREGNCCLIAPGVRHSIAVFDDSVVLNILIRRSTFLDIFLNAVPSQSQLALFFLGGLSEKKRANYLVYRPEGDKQLSGYILEMTKEQYDSDVYTDRIMISLLTLFFYQLTRRYGDTVETLGQKGKKNPQGEAIMNYILEHFDTVSIHSLSEHFHFAEPYCSKLVKDISGSTFTELLTSIRMRRSENLLAHTQLSVEEISAQVGYKNPESFIRCFKRIYRASPSQYRRDPEAVLMNNM